MKAVCIIPARGGSVRIPRKNVRDFAGKPMLVHSIEAAQQSMLFKRVIVSTDDSEIERAANETGAGVYWRDKDNGVRGTQEIAREVLFGDECLAIKPALACVLYPCAPLLTKFDLVNGWRRLLQADGFAYVHVDGGFYWGFTSAFIEGVPLAGHSRRIEHPHHIDIDTEEQWQWTLERYRTLHP